MSVAEGINAYCYGDSWYGADIMNSSFETRGINRVNRRVGFKSLTNRAVPAYSTADNLYQASIPGAPAWTPGTKGIVIMPYSINDLFYNDSVSDSVFSEIVGSDMDGMINLLSSAGKVEENNSAHTYSGGWISLATGGASAGAVRYTQTDGAYVNYTPGTTAVSIATSSLIESSYNNMKITVTQNGSVKGVYDAADKNFGGGIADAAKSKIFRVNGLTPGVPMRITYNTLGRSNAFGYFDGIIRPAAAPPTILLVKPVLIPSLIYPAYNNQTRVNIIRSQADAFASTYSNVFTCDPAPGFDYTTMIGLDTVHPNDKGMYHLANTITAAIESLPFRNGMHSV